MFTDRYVRLPIRVYDRKISELINKSNAEEEDSYMMMNPFNIVKYRPTWDKDDDEKKEIVTLTDITGDETLVYLSVDEFEKLLNNALSK